MRARTLVAVVILVAGLLTTVVLAQEVVSVRRYVIPGGGTVSENASYILKGSIGQPFTAESSDGTYRLAAGYWPGQSTAVSEGAHIYLPLIRR